MTAPNSYKDPFWSDLASATEQKLGLPEGLLVAVLTKGERSNADQTSSAGAKTPFQIIPATRVAAAKKFGVDAYLSPQNAAEVAGLLLKDSLKRNSGDLSSAIGEYIGGTDRSNWGRTTRAYIDRVMAGIPQQEAPADAPVQMPAQDGPSTFDRVFGEAFKPSASQLAKVAEAYKSGKMAPDERAQFEADVRDGKVMLPKGMSIEAAPTQGAPQAPAGVLAAYQSGQMDPKDKAQFEADLKAGMWSLPPNLSLNAAGVGARIPDAPQMPQKRAPDPSLGQQAIGAGEAVLSTLTGATGGALGMAGGFLGGLAGSVSDGSYGSKAGADAIERAAVEGAQGLTYAPRTETGQQYAKAVGEGMQQALPAIGAMGGLPKVAMPGGNPAALARASAEGTARDAVNLVARPAEAVGAVAPGVAGDAAAAAVGRGADAVGTAAQSGAQRVSQMTQAVTTLPRRALEAITGGKSEKPTPGTLGSAGAAGADMSAQRVATAEGLPVPVRLTKGEATRDPAQMKFENEASKNPELGQPLRERIQENNSALLRNFDSMIDQTGAEAPSLRAVGQTVDAALVKQAAKDKAEVRAAYKAAESAGEMESPVALDSLVAHLNESAPDAATAPLLDVARSRALRLGIAAEDANGNLVAQPVPLKIAETYRQAISRATDFEPTNVRQSTIIKGLVDESTAEMGGGLYKQARAMRARYAQNYENHAVIADLLRTRRGTTDRQVALEDVFRQSILRSSLDDVRQVRRILQRGGEEGQQAWRELQGAAATWVRDQATTGATDGAGTRVISPAALDKAVRELDRGGKLDFIFSRQGAQTMRDLRDVAQYVRTAPPEAAFNYAHTASTLLTSFGDIFISGATGTPAPIMTAGRIGLKWIKDNRLRKRIEDALQDAEKQHAPTRVRPVPQTAPAPETLH